MKLRNVMMFCAAFGFAVAANAAAPGTDDATAPAKEVKAEKVVAPKAADKVVAKKAVTKKAAVKAVEIQKVDINKADEQTLAGVKCVGAKKAKAIVEYRTQNGDFKSVEDLTNVKGFHKKSLKKASKYLTV